MPASRTEQVLQAIEALLDTVPSAAVERNSAVALQQAVNAAMLDGWTPHGCHSVAFGPKGLSTGQKGAACAQMLSTGRLD